MDYLEHSLQSLRKLANGEEPYGGGPFDADHVKLFPGDAERLTSEVDRLRAQVAALTGEHSGTCDELAPCQRCADRDELTELRAISSTARRMYASSDAGDHQDAAHASRTLRDLLGEA